MQPMLFFSDVFPRGKKVFRIQVMWGSSLFLCYDGYNNFGMNGLASWNICMYWIKMTDGNVYFISSSHRIAQLKTLPRLLIWGDAYIVLLGIVLVVLAKQRAVNVNVMCRLISLNGLGSCVCIKISLFFLLKETTEKGMSELCFMPGFLNIAGLWHLLF